MAVHFAGTAVGVTLAALLGLNPAAAQTYTWVGNGSSPYWDVTANWNPASLPTAGSAVTNNTANTIEHRQNTDSIDSFTANSLGAFLLSGGILNIASSFSTNGNYSQTGGTLNVANFTATSTSNTLSLTGGTLNVTGTLSTASTFTINGGTLQNATITNPSLLSFGNSQSTVLDNVTLGGSSGLNVIGTSSNAYVHIADSFSFTSGATFNVNSASTAFGSYLLFDSTSGNPNPTFNNATVNLGSSGYGYVGFGNSYTVGNSLTLGNGLTIQGQGGVGSIYGNPTGVNLINNGIINASISNINADITKGALNVSTYINGNLTNNGTIEATGLNSSSTVTSSGTGSLINNGSILANGSFTTITINGNVTTLGTVKALAPAAYVYINSNISTSQTGGLSATGGGRIYLQGNVDNMGNTFDVASVSGSSGLLVLSGGTFSGGTINNANQLYFGGSTSTVLDNVTLGGGSGLNVRPLNVIGSTLATYVRIADSFNFTNGATFNVGGGNNYASLLFDSTSGNPNPIFNNATVNLGISGYTYQGKLGFGNGYSAGNSLTLGSGLTVQGAGAIGYVYGTPTGANLINNGIINANIASDTLNVNTFTNGSITNNGTIKATASNSSANIIAGSNGNLTNTGTMQATGSGSSISLTTSGTGILTNTGTILSNGTNSTVTISGTLAAAGLGNVTASGSTAKVVINSALNLPTQINGLSVANGGSIFLQGNVNNTGNTFDVASVVGAAGSNGLLVLNGGTFSGGTINNAHLLGFGTSTSTVLDNVTLGGSSGLNVNSVNNNVANYIASVHIADSFNFANGATFTVGIGNSYGYLLFDSTSGNPNPTFDNATVNLGGSASYLGELGFGTGYSAGNSLTLGSGLIVQGKGTVGSVYSTPTGVNLINKGIINANFNSALNVTTYTNGSITNNGTIEATASSSSSTITTSGTGSLINNGTILANGTNSTVTINGTVATLGTVKATTSGAQVLINSSLNTSQLGGLSVTSGGSIFLQGNVNNTGNTFDVASVVGAAGSNGLLVLNGGTFSGGTINNANLLSFGSSNSSILDNVTLGGSSGLNVNSIYSSVVNYNAYAHIADSFNFANGATFTVGIGNSYGYLLFDSTSGNPNPTFDNATVNLASQGRLGFGNGYSAGNSLTLGSGLTIQGATQGGSTVGFVNGGLAGVNLINNGVINRSDVLTYTNGNLTNNGTITNSAITAGTNGNLTNTGTIQALNGSAYLATGGTGKISNTGTIQATTSSATVTVNSGTGTGGGTLTNSGTILATGGGKVTVSGNSLTNTGTLQVNAGSTLALSSTTTNQTAGTTVVNGTLTVTNSSGNVFNLQGGSLYGTGTFTGSLTNTGGTVAAGILGATPSIGTLTVSGNYTQGANGIFSAALAGATQASQYDVFTVGGIANFAGRLDINLLNSYVPTIGQTFQIIKDSNGTTGAFNNVSNGQITDASGHYLFQVIYGSSGVTLTFQGSDATPEPGTATLLLGIGMPGGALALLVSRRRKTK